MPEDAEQKGQKSERDKRPAPDGRARPEVDSTDIGGDSVGRDKISAGDIKSGVVAFGQGATAIQGDVHYHYESTAKSGIPRQDYEPETVQIPAGVFLMGSNVGGPEEAPLHEVDLPDYSIGRFPVTNEQFARFVWDTNRRIDSRVLQWYGNEPPPDRLNYPVAGISWYDAAAYCLWLENKTGRSYRLPNEAQWEKAARTEDGRLYPWGSEWKDGRCNSSSTITAVDAFPQQSRFGCYDMVGNVREWTVAIWGKTMRTPDPSFAYPWKDDRRNDPSEPPTSWRVYRGGRFDQAAAYRCSARGGYLPKRPGPPSNRHGFRVVLLIS